MYKEDFCTTNCDADKTEISSSIPALFQIKVAIYKVEIS